MKRNNLAGEKNVVSGFGWLIRLTKAVPDIITAGLCLAVWIVPEKFDTGFLLTMMLVMVIEFLVIHATIMVPVFLVVVPERFGGIYTAFIGGSILYLLFAVGASLATGTWWPTLAFGWLLASRYVFPLLGKGGDDGDVDWFRLWVLSTVLWLVLVFATIFLPIPDFGFSFDIRESIASSASGIWVDEPHRLLAFALIYFTSLAVFKLTSRAPESAAAVIR